MSETETNALIDRIAVAIESLALRARPIPLSIDLWDVDTIALYLKRETRHVREKIVCMPEFPKSIILPSSGPRFPLWKATEVIAWAEAHRDQTAGRPRKDRRDD